MIRITGGALRGRALKVAPGVRPTGGRAREALFDIWSPRLAGSRFLDLFAGSGAVGIEALSRGAASCVAIERAGSVFRALSANYEALMPLDATGDWQLSRAPLPQGLSADWLRQRGPFDLVFADPPYEFSRWSELLGGIGPHLVADGEVVLEHGRRNRPPAGAGSLELSSRRPYGETELSFYEPSSAEPLSAERPR